MGGAVGFSRCGLAAASSDAIPQSPHATPAAFIERAYDMRDAAVRMGDQSYGAVIVNADGVIVGQAPSHVIVHSDPTAHEEMEAMRDASCRLRMHDLSGHVMYSSSRPCPMCEAAAYWANLSEIVHGRSGENAGRPKLCRR